LLREAKALGDFLIVGLNSDFSVREIKGDGRPVVDEINRYQVLSAIKYVDKVIIFNESTPEKLIEELRPDILVKGEDWEDKKVVGAEYVKKVVFIPFTQQISTTKILERRKKNA
jgi:rfaE bifunctional protein nucleotidyltransferase chain/domain